MTIIAAILILLGLAGSVLPFLPGPPLSFAGLLLYGYATNFQATSSAWLYTFGILTLFTIVLDFAAPALGAKKFKSSKYGTYGSVIGAFVGIFLLGPLGLLLGPLIGSFLGEYYATSDPQKSLEAAWGSFLGFLAGTALKLAVALAIAVYFFTNLFYSSNG